MKETRFESFASLRDSLAAMSLKIVETEVLRVAATVRSGEAGVAGVRSATVGWIEDRAGARLPERAAERTFSWECDRLRCEAIRGEDGERDVWVVRVEHGEENGGSGSLATEVGVVGNGDGPTRLFTRVLSTVGHAFGGSPDLIVRLAERYEVTQFGVPLSASPLVIKSEQDAEALVRWLTHASRRLPVIALSVPDDAEDPYLPLLDPVELARDAAGIAQVAVLPSRFTWLLTQRFYKKLSVYRGAVRIYQPGFDGVNAGESHWAVMADRLTAAGGAQRHRADILRRVGERSVADQEAPPSFAELRERAGAAPPPAESAGSTSLPVETAGSAQDAVEDAPESSAESAEDEAATLPDLAATVGGRNRDGSVDGTPDASRPASENGGSLQATPADAAAEDPVTTAPPPSPSEQPPGWFARLGFLVRMMRPGGYAAEAARIRAPAERDKERLERELKSSRKRLDELSTKLRSTRDEAEYFLAENQEAEARAGKREKQLDEANARVARLEEQVRSLGHTPLPSGWEDFVSWCEHELAGSLILSPRARREIKNARFADVPVAARCVLWLASEYRDGRLNGAGASLRIEESGIRNEPCGGDKVQLKWRGENRFADWHLKNGGNTRDPARCLRIYYLWDEETRQVVIASMPAHVRSALT